jgi:hypothetical protein
VEFRSGKERGRGEIIEERASYFAKWRVRGDNGHLYLLSDHEIVKVLNG